MTEDVHVQKVLRDGVVVLHYGGRTASHRVALWVKAKLRKQARCIVSDRLMEPGEMAYRPVGNEDYRAKRIHAETLEKAVEMMREVGEEI